ncbi:MAG: hypothetical protein A4E35_02192 [Methanoregula sp. PtaU1.Bin051]|nr:MAG: hypothetical protein A4E35_02192 [Methanoregula sp. PtaU1.Bin051]
MGFFKSNIPNAPTVVSGVALKPKDETTGEMDIDDYTLEITAFERADLEKR